MRHLFGSSRQAVGQLMNAVQKHECKKDKIIKLVKEQRMRQPRMGSIKLYRKLKPKFVEMGIKCGRDKLIEILKERRLLVPKKKLSFRTTDSNHRFHKHKNRIKGKVISKPEQVWAADITYIQTSDGHMYLNIITDCYSHKIMGYHLSNDLTAASTKKALVMALKNRNYPKRKLIHHSDRGLQYCSNEYTNLLRKNGIKISMTTKYDPYENSIAERINGILKQEFSISDKRMNKKEIHKIVNQSIYIYNYERSHFSCQLMTPAIAHIKGRYKYKQWGKFAITDHWK